MKRLFTWLLILAMVLSMIPLSVLATEEATMPETEPMETIETVPGTEPEQETEPKQETEPTEETQPAREVEHIELPFTVNPLYEGIFKEVDFPQSEKIDPAPGEEKDHSGLDFWQDQDLLYAENYLTIDAATKQLKQHMLNRDETFTLYFKAKTNDYNEHLAQMLMSAVEHTGKPKEGDYLQWHYAGWGGYVDYFWENGECCFVFEAQLAYSTTAAQEKELDTAVTDLLNSLNLSGKSEYQKIKAVYDYVCQNITYDYANLEDETYLLKHSAYAALINKTAVCQGYATLIYRLLLELGVDVRVIPGLAEDGTAHAWNIVRIGDVYYNLDATWDAGYEEYYYFLRNTINFPYHYRYMEYATTQFHADYPIAQEDYADGVPGVPEKYFVIGVCGDEVAFGIDRERNLVIAGQGPMWDFTSITLSNKENCPPWYYWVDAFSHVVVEDGVTNVGEYAFASMKNVTDVTMADSVTEIRTWAFDSCYELTTVTMGAGVKSIGYGAFQKCRKLEKAELPEGLTTVDSYAFENTALTEVILPDSVTSLGSSAFKSCSKLQNLKIGSSLKVIPGYAFAEATALTELTLPETLEEIRSHAFEGCTGLTELTIPANITKLGGFEFCTGITKITFLGDAPEIDGTAFARITATVYYPADNDTWTGEKQKNYDGTLTWIRSDGHEHEYSGVVTPPTCTQSGYTVFTCNVCGVTYKGAYVQTIDHEYGEWYVEEEASCLKHGTERRDCINCDFYDSRWINQTQDHTWDSGTVTDPTCTELGFTTYTCTVCSKSYVDTYVKMLGHTPGAATCSEEALCTVCGEGTGVFEPHVFDTQWSGSDISGHWHSCIHCDEHDAPETHTPNVAFATNETALYCTVCGFVIEDQLDYGNVTVVDEGLWDYGPMKWKLTSDGVLTIYAGKTFQGQSTYIWKEKYADQIRRVVIADGVRNVPNYAFSSLPNLTSVYLGNAVEYIDREAFSGCDKLYEITIPASVTEIKLYAFSNCDNLVSVTFEEGSALKTIRQFAFYKTGITKLTTPASLTLIEEGAFKECKSLYDVHLTDGLVEIGSDVFKNCSNLKNVYIPETFRHSSWNAFSGCAAIEKFEFYGFDGFAGLSRHSNLKTAVFAGNATKLSEGAFYDCISLIDVTIGEKITQISNRAFYNCTSLTEISLHDQITSLGEEAFAYSGLASLTIPASVTNVASCAFRFSEIEEITFLGDAPNFAEDAFDGITATVIYRGNNPTWTEDKIQSYGGNITWVDLDYHEHVYKTEMVEPTCTEGGYTTYTCTVCEKSHVADETEKLGHDLPDWTVTVAATCTTDGSKTRTCQREGCDYSESEVIPASGHNYVAAVTAPTCTTGGYTTHTCSICGDTYVTDEVPALGHTCTYTVTTAPTAETDGMLSAVCGTCSETVTQVLPKLNKTDYTLTVITAPTKEAEGEGIYAWNVTDYGEFAFNVVLEKLPPVVLGDINDDGEVTILDLMRLANHFANGVAINEANADVNGDGQVTILDLMRLANYFAGNATLG